MKTKYMLALVFLSFLLVGCPITGKYPLEGDKREPIDERLLGEWRSVKSKDIGDGSIKIFQFNEIEYYIEAKGDTDNSVSRVRAFIAIIDNVRILNTQDIKNNFSGQEYTYIKYEVSKDNVLTFWTMNSKSVPEKDIGEKGLHDCIRSNIHNEKFYEMVGQFARLTTIE